MDDNERREWQHYPADMAAQGAHSPDHPVAGDIARTQRKQLSHPTGGGMVGDRAAGRKSDRRGLRLLALDRHAAWVCCCGKLHDELFEHEAVGCRL